MAMVMRVGYFCTAGYTEAGGIQRFLDRLRPDIQWVRCFPAFDKPAPKMRKEAPVLSGITGTKLIERMLEVLAKHYQGEACTFDHVLLLDDADCRLVDPSGALSRQLASLPGLVRDATGKPGLGFLALLASPEIEAWLLADWEEGFGKEYAEIEYEFRRKVEELLGQSPWTDVEEYGAPFVQASSSCTSKLSTDIQGALAELAKEALEKLEKGGGGEIDRNLYAYSKKSHGPRMLQRIRADKVAALCMRHFKPVYQKILELQPPTVSQPPQETAASASRKKPQRGAPKRRKK